MKTLMYSDRHKLFPNIVIISHNTSWGCHFKDHRYWMAELNGDVWDYDSKRNLIADCVKENLAYVVLRCHKNGSATNIACSGLAGTEAAESEGSQPANR